MSNLFKKLFLVFIVSLVLLNFYLIVKDANAGARADSSAQLKKAASSWGEAAPAGETSLSGIVATIIKAFLGFLGIIFLVLIIYAGFNWMTAGGEEEKVTLAKNTLTRAIIGLVIITAAYAITYFVFSNLPGQGPSTSNNSGGGSEEY